MQAPTRPLRGSAAVWPTPTCSPTPSAPPATSTTRPVAASTGAETPAAVLGVGSLADSARPVDPAALEVAAVAESGARRSARRGSRRRQRAAGALAAGTAMIFGGATMAFFLDADEDPQEVSTLDPSTTTAPRTPRSPRRVGTVPPRRCRRWCRPGRAPPPRPSSASRPTGPASGATATAPATAARTTPGGERRRRRRRRRWRRADHDHPPAADHHDPDHHDASGHHDRPPSTTTTSEPATTTTTETATTTTTDTTRPDRRGSARQHAADPHDRRTLLDGDLEVGGGPHRQAGQAVVGAELARGRGTSGGSPRAPAPAAAWP